VRNATLDTLYEDHLRTMMQRTDRALAAAKFDALVVHAGAAPLRFLDDQTYPYKVNPHFKAWVPIIDNPQCVLIYVPGSRPRVLFNQPNDYWHKPASLPHEAWTHCVELIPTADPAAASEEWAKRGRVAFIGPRKCFAAQAGAAQAGAEQAAPTLNDPDLLARLHFDRAVKTPYELECLRRASELGARGHLAALSAFRRGASEYETQMRYLEACAQREEEMPYNNIVAYNENAAILHYQNLERRPPKRLRSLLIDAGAQYRGYASDITRTYAADPGLYSELIDALNAAQLKLCAEIVPGKDYREVHLSAHRILGDVLHSIGLTRLPGQAAIEEGVTGVFFPHGIGHLLGLQVHDVGGVMSDSTGGEVKRPEGHPYLRLTRMLEPGVVVTVEPGIYLIDSLLRAAREDKRAVHIDWAVVEQLRPFGGIRIEDNVVATNGAPENLTRDAFARLAA
jgi:Xaa-Pro dipeptidase